MSILNGCNDLICVLIYQYEIGKAGTPCRLFLKWVVVFGKKLNLLVNTFRGSFVPLCFK